MSIDFIFWLRLKPIVNSMGYLLLFICFGLLASQPAHADFRKAVNAYIARDGDLLMQEVKEAVDKKNDDGLMLFLMATNFDAATSEYDEITKQSKSTLRAILPSPKWDALREMLVQATENSTADARYYFLTSSQFKVNYTVALADEYFKKGSGLATLDSRKANISNKAEACLLEAQITTAFRYLGHDDLLCDKQQNDKACQIDVTKGMYWIKQAIKTYERNSKVDVDILPSRMCNYLRSIANGDKKILTQAYLWAGKGIDEMAVNNSASISCMTKLSDISREVKNMASTLDTVHFDYQRPESSLPQANITKLPELVIEAREETKNDDLPIFSYYFGQVGRGSILEVYQDGRIIFGTDDLKKDLLKKVSPVTVMAFMKEMKKTGFLQWSSTKSGSGYCPDFHACELVVINFERSWRF